MADVLVVGAGLAGLVASGTLAGGGAAVTLLEAADRPGGRLATRRVGDATADDGAQFFTVRDPDFGRLVAGWRTSGCPVETWCRGFAQAPSIASDPATAELSDDGHPRYVPREGMERLAGHLARRLTVRVRRRAVAVRACRGGFETVLATGETRRAARLLLTPPVPQALALLDRGSLAFMVDPEVLAGLRTVTYAPCLSLLVELDRSPRLPAPGGVQFDDGPVRFLADNAAKQVSAVPAVTVHAAAAFSRAHAAEPDQTVIGRLIELVRPWLRGARPRHLRLTRWRYAQPSLPRQERAVTAVEDGGGRVVLAGDAFAGAKIEGAALSGLAAAELLSR